MNNKKYMYIRKYMYMTITLTMFLVLNNAFFSKQLKVLQINQVLNVLDIYLRTSFILIAGCVI